MNNYTLSIWTHDDNHLRDLRTKVEFEGQAYNAKYKKKVNGQEELSFSLPLYIMNKMTGNHEENPAWFLIKNERKIRLIRKRGTEQETIHDFVIKDYDESRSGFEKILNIQCQGYSLFELGRIGFTGVFSEDTLENESEILKGNIDFWVDRILTLTKNKYSGTNTSGWQFEIDTPNNILYEEENIIGFEQSGSEWLPVYEEDGSGNKIELEKERIIKAEKSNVFNLLQEVAEKFQVWAHFIYEYNELYKTISRKIVFKKEVELEAPYTINYGINSDKMSRTHNSDDLITKLYVEPIESEFEDDGIMSISKAPQNLTMENFIYNFDYYYNEGYMSAQEYADSIAYQHQLRGFNIQYRPKVLNLIAKFNEIDVLESELQFIEYEISAGQEIVRRLSNEISIYPSGNVRVSDMIFVVLERDGQYFADVSVKKGTKTGNFTIKKFNFDSTGISIAQYIMMDDDPTSVKEVRFSGNPDSSTNRVRLSFTHNPIEYLNKIIRNEQSKISSLEKKRTSIDNEIIVLDNDITTIQSQIQTLLNNKQDLIDSFESEHSIFIREGNWRNSDYILRKTREEINSPTISYTTTTETGYVLTSNLNNVNLESIRLWTTNDEYEYFPIADFSIQYGTVSGIRRLLLIPEPNSAFFLNKLIEGSTLLTQNATLNIRYENLAGAKISSTVSRNASCIVWNRHIDIPYENILPATISIYPEAGDEALLRNIDYSYQVYENYSRISLNPSQNALHLVNYFKITFDTNNTVKFFYEDAKDIADRSSKPRVEYKIDFVDLSSLEGMEDFEPKTGQKILIKDPELFQEALYGFVAEIDYDLEREENNQIVISNYTTKFEDLFQRIVASAERLASRADSYERAASIVEPNGILKGDILQQSFLDNYIAFNAGLNNEVSWGRDGLTLTDASGISTVPPQVKIVGTGIFLSNTLGSTGRREWRTGITGNGINAAMLTAGAINTKEVTIWGSDEPRFLWNVDGLTAYGVNEDTGSTIFDTFVRYNHEGLKFQREFWDGEEQILITELSLTWDGLRIGAQRDAVLITSERGLQVLDSNQYERIQIGRLFHNDQPTDNFGMKLKNENGEVTLETASDGNLWLRHKLTIGQADSSAGITADNSGTNPSNATFWSGGELEYGYGNELGPNFVITRDGVLKATDGEILGQITVGVGIGSNYAGLNSDGDVRFWAGATPINKAIAPFRVLSDGTLHATQANITGEITATSGTFSGTVNATGGNFTNQVYIGQGAGSRIVLDGTNLRLSSDLYQSGVRGWAINGDGSAEFENVNVRGTIKSAVFTYDEINAQGGSLMIAPSGILHEEINRTVVENDVFIIKVTKPYIGYPGVFNVGDTLRIRTHVADGSVINLWMKIEPTGIDTSNSDFIAYTIRILPNSTSDTLTIANGKAIPVGTAIVDYRQENNGMILLEANDLTNGPFVDIIENEGSNIYQAGSQYVRVRLGNLSGITDSNFDGGLQGYGLYAENAYLTGSIALPNAGITNIGTLDSDIRIWAGSTMGNRATAPFRVQQDGTMNIGDGQMVFDATSNTISFGSGVTMSWGSISNPPEIPDGYEVIITGDHIKFGETNTTLTAVLLKNGENVTNQYLASQFEWFIGETSYGTGFTKIFQETDINTSAQVRCIFRP